MSLAGCAMIVVRLSEQIHAERADSEAAALSLELIRLATDVRAPLRLKEMATVLLSPNQESSGRYPVPQGRTIARRRLMAGWPIRMPNAALSWRGHVAGRDSNAVVRRRRVRSRRIDSALSRAPRANEGGQQRHAPCSHRHLRPEADRQRQIAVHDQRGGAGWPSPDAGVGA